MRLYRWGIASAAPLCSRVAGTGTALALQHLSGVITDTEHDDILVDLKATRALRRAGGLRMHISVTL